MKWTYMYFETHDLLGRVDGLYSTFCNNQASKLWYESKDTLYIVSSTNIILHVHVQYCPDTRYNAFASFKKKHFALVSTAFTPRFDRV